MKFKSAASNRGRERGRIGQPSGAHPRPARAAPSRHLLAARRLAIGRHCRHTRTAAPAVRRRAAPRIGGRLMRRRGAAGPEQREAAADDEGRGGRGGRGGREGAAEDGDSGQQSCHSLSRALAGAKGLPRKARSGSAWRPHLPGLDTKRDCAAAAIVEGPVAERVALSNLWFRSAPVFIVGGFGADHCRSGFGARVLFGSSAARYWCTNNIQHAGGQGIAGGICVHISLACNLLKKLCV